MPAIDIGRLKTKLDNLYNEYDFKERLSSDPIFFLYQYKENEDVETVGFIASSFAYGKVELFIPIIGEILKRMGKNPYDFIINFDLKREGTLFSTVRYRFSDTDDILSFLLFLQKILRKYSRLENLFKKNYSNGDPNIKKALQGLIQAFREQVDLSFPHIQSFYMSKKRRGFLFFYPSPEKGSPCKRLNLFLRWMIRDKDIDLGIWKGIPKNKLIIPLDTHIARISRCLSLTTRKSLDWKTAEEITESLKLLDPIDPLKYDFVLCHYGIAKLCSDKGCERCQLSI